MQCKYCYENNGYIINPCKCKSPVHMSCLVKWNSFRKNNEYCEICKEIYKFSLYENLYCNFRKILVEYSIYLFTTIIIYFFLTSYSINNSMKAYEMI